MTSKSTTKSPRHRAITELARELLRVDFDMDHADTERSFSTRELQRVLEETYDRGQAARAALRSVRGGDSPEARADAAAASVRELELRVLKLEQRIRELESGAPSGGTP